MPTTAFNGFPKGTVAFLEALRKNNNRIWFEQHRGDYAEWVLGPAWEFVMEMGERLRSVCPNIHAIPLVDKSIFRIRRDVRFSSDKRPFKTHLGIWFWDGNHPKMESPGFYFHLEPPTILWGVGIYMFTGKLIPEYRAAMVLPIHGPALKRALAPVLSHGRYRLVGKHYKRVPRGFDLEHEHADLLKYKGYHLGVEQPISANASPGGSSTSRFSITMPCSPCISG